MLTPLAQRVIDAYGGEDRWRNASAVECRISAHGWAFRMKLRHAMKRTAVRASIGEPNCEFLHWPKRNRKGVLDGARQVRIENREGEVLKSRDEPRSYFPGGRRRFRWDNLDFLYFGAYACWNYVTFPALLLREDIEWGDISETTLEAKFPDSVPTHSPVQQFHIDPDTALLRQHDYTAEVFGDWAHAANVVLERDTWEGIPYPTRRKVTPRKADGTPRPFPLLVGIEITDWRLASA